MSIINYQSSISIISAFLLIAAALSSHGFSQTKSLETARAEAAGTPGITVAYDETRYITTAAFTTDSLPANEFLGKQFRKFKWTMETWFAIKGIDAKPVRVVLCLATQSKRFAFTSDRELVLSFDREDVLLGEAQRTSEVKGGKARENLCWEVDEMITKDFAKASSAFFAIGRTGGVFSSESLGGFRKYERIVTVEN